MNPRPESGSRPRQSRARRAQQRSWRQLVVTVPQGERSLLAPVRRLIVASLLDWGAGLERARDIELCASELLTNALIHGEGAAHLHLTIRNGVAYLEVSDTSTHAPTAPEDYMEGHRESGRGFFITYTLAKEVCVDIRPGRGKTVTASFSLR